MTDANDLTAVVADDSVLLRDGIVRLLDDGGIEVVAAVGDGDALANSTDDRLDLLVVQHGSLTPAPDHFT